jgi:3-hydroxybutyryl-CoA dehydrogenase
MKVTHQILSTAVVGCGYMGGGIAQVMALHGYRVNLGEIDAETAERARDRICREAEQFESLKLLPEGAAKIIEANLVASDSIEAAVEGVDYVAEAVPEEPALKSGILKRISVAALPEAIIGTNTSAIPIGQLAEALVHPGRFLGVHWMNPAPFVPGVELIPGHRTAAETLKAVEVFIRELGKVPSTVADTPGFVANRLQFALFNEAARMVEEGVATPTEIDAVVSNSFGFRLALFGPFAIADMAGLDVYESAFETLQKAYGERFSPPPALTRLVRNGHLGLKSDHGFLECDPAVRPDLIAYRDNAYAKLSQLRLDLGPVPGFRTVN